MYSLPSGYEAVTGETIQASQHNPPLEDIESAMSARLMRSGVAPMTGPLKMADGSVGSPALTFNTATTTGLYTTANGIGVSVNGTKVAEFTSAGISGMLGEIKPWALLTAPARWVLIYGQTLSRTTYADLWAIAQTEIAAGNTFFNNGDGTTTFGIADARGRVIAGKDNMGGSAAGRISLATSGMDGTVIGATGGEQVHTLSISAIPAHAHTGTTGTMDSNASHLHTNNPAYIRPASASSPDFNAFTPADASFGVGGMPNTTATNTDHRHPFTTNNAGGGGAHNNIQPTIICNYILYAGA